MSTMALSEKKKREIRALADSSSEALVALAKKAPMREEDLQPRQSARAKSGSAA